MRNCFFIIVIFFFINPIFSLSGEEILNKMFMTIDSIQSIEFELLSSERFGNEYKEDKGYIRVKYKPYSVYYRQIVPDQGVEIFYTEGENDNKATVKLNKFPYLTLNFAPIHLQMRKNRHHTIFETGVMKYMADATKNIINKNKETVVFDYKGLYKINEILCYRVTINNPDFKLVEYTIQENETLFEVAKKFKVCDYMIVELNNNIKNYEDIFPGKKIMIPSEYAKTIEFNIDKKSYLPVLIKIYDDVGLFENYYFKDIKTNQL